MEAEDEAREPRIVWQPVVRIATGEVVGHEALARFEYSGPKEAFADAHQRGVALSLDRRCRMKAFSTAPPGGLLFINLAPATVSAMEEGYTRIDADGVDPRRIVWELPEAAGWPFSRRAADAVLAALPKGSMVALDDFGVGSADVEKLVLLRPAVIKVARELADGVARSAEAQAVFRMLLDWAERFGAIVAAEGVEREEDAKKLLELGVPWGQGFLWGLPKALVA